MSYGQYGPRPPNQSKPATKQQSDKVLKHVFDNPAHVAFHPLQKDGSGYEQTDARNKQGNWYFKTEGEMRTVYSYRDSYPIASRFPLGKKIIFLSRSGKPWGVTTAGHMSATYNALPKDDKNTLVFCVPTVATYRGLTKETHLNNLADYIIRINEEIGEYTHGRSLYTIQHALGRATSLADEAKLYAKTFHLPAPKLPKIPKLTAEREAKAKAYDAASDARAAARKAARDARWAEQSRVNALEQAEKIAAWRAGSTARFWNLNEGGFALLRVKDKNVETSMGVTVPINGPTGAARLLRFLQALKVAGRTYQTNGHSEHIAQFTVTSFDGEVLVAGCHRIKWAEIEAIAEQVLALAE